MGDLILETQDRGIHHLEMQGNRRNKQTLKTGTGWGQQFWTKSKKIGFKLTLFLSHLFWHWIFLLTPAQDQGHCQGECETELSVSHCKWDMSLGWEKRTRKIQVVSVWVGPGERGIISEWHGQFSTSTFKHQNLDYQEAWYLNSLWLDFFKSTLL